MNDKWFLVYEKRGILSDSPLSGEEGGSIEPLVKILELIRAINEEKSVKESANNSNGQTTVRKINSKKSRKSI